jgi:hypothetical protein
MPAKKKSRKIGASARKGAKRGPKEDRLKLDGDWKDAMRRSLDKKKPEGGWPR